MKTLIESKIDKLFCKHKTNNPLEIAKAEGIIVIREPLGSINGYYNKFVKQKIIHVNSDLSYTSQLFTCGHELGHAILHEDSNTPFLINNTFYSINKLERQANMFSAYLLIHPNIFSDYCGYSFDYISKCEHIPTELLKLRYEMLGSSNKCL